MRFVRKLASVWTDRWLIGLIVASLMVPPAYYGLVAYQSRTATFAAADRQFIGVVKLLREHVQKVFDTDELVIKLVDRLTAGLSWDEIEHSERLHLLLKQLDEQLPQVNGIYLVAPDGTVANSSRVFPVRPSNLQDHAYFTSLREGYQGSFISDVHPGRTSGVLQFNVARRRSSWDGRFNGVILLSDDPAYFENAYRSIGDSAASVVLARDDGVELVSYPAPMFSGSRAPADLIASVPQNDPLLVSSIPLPYDATPRQGAFQRIDGYPLFIGYSVPLASITASWRRTVILNGMLVAFGSLTVAFMGWLILRGYRSERSEARRREQAEAKMIDAMRMEAIGQLTAGVAHDFSNLLTVISGNIERLHTGDIGNGKARIEAALSATARGDALIRKMLTFARRHARDREIVDINAALTSFTPLLGSALSKSIVVEYHLSSQPVICRIDHAEFDFAVLNIVTNAGHAMPNGGRLKIMTSTEPVTARSELELAIGEYAKIAISDNGQGMPPDVVARAFELFFTTRERGIGTGLGLSQVYGFAKQSGGTVTIDSAVGCGTTVMMYLPVVAMEALGEPASAVMVC
jgi:two-component system, NtrC family, sensor kinase